jgi:hypothetical protein
MLTQVQVTGKTGRISKRQYELWSLLIFGNIPLDYDWAVETIVWKENYGNFAKYPQQ